MAAVGGNKGEAAEDELALEGRAVLAPHLTAGRNTIVIPV
jgi:hypothetical protein